MKYVVTYTYKKQNITAIETTDKAVAKSIHNRFHHLGFSPVTYWKDENGNTVRTISYNK